MFENGVSLKQFVPKKISIISFLKSIGYADINYVQAMIIQIKIAARTLYKNNGGCLVKFYFILWPSMEV